MRRRASLLAVLLMAGGCDGETNDDPALDAAPDVETVDATAPDIDAPDIDAPDIDAPDIEAPDIEAPDGAPADAGRPDDEGAPDDSPPADEGAPDDGTPDAGAPDAGPGPDHGPPPEEVELPDPAYGAATGEWAFTFDDGDYVTAHAWFGTDDDGLGLVVRADGTDDRLHRNYDAEARLHACRGVSDEVRLRVSTDAVTMYGHLVRAYRCGLVGEDEAFADAEGWPEARFDTVIERGMGGALVWRRRPVEGAHGVLDGGWTLEATGLACDFDLFADGGFTGDCLRDYPWPGVAFAFEGRLEAPMVSGSTDDTWAFAGQRVAEDVERGDAPPAGDPLGGASGRWAVWGSRGASELAAGARLELSAEGTTVTAAMDWQEVQPGGFCRVIGFDTTIIEHDLEVELTVDGDGPAGDALWLQTGRCPNGESFGALPRTFTAVRTEGAPAALPLLGGAWQLIEPGERDFDVSITLRGDVLRVEKAQRRGNRIFEGRIDPRQAVGVDRTRDLGATDWAGGRRLDEE